MAKKKIPTEILTNPNKIKEVKKNSQFGFETFKILPLPTAFTEHIAEINNAFSTHGIDLTNYLDDIKSGKTSCGKYFLSKEYLTALFDDEQTLGLWIWLMKEGTNTWIITSNAGRTLSMHKIPDLNRRYMVHNKDESDGTVFIMRSYYRDDMSWKNIKKNEGHFNGTKGFFVGKFVTNYHLSGAVRGIQIEVLQESDGSPTLCFYQVLNRQVVPFGYCQAKPRELSFSEVPDPGAGLGVSLGPLGSASCSRPCPTYCPD